MKNPPIISLIVLSALGIMLLVFFQLRWLLVDRDLRNDQFNQRVSMALCEAVSEIATDVKTCQDIKSCMEVHQNGDIFEQRLCQKVDTDKLNTTLKGSLAKHNIPLPYTYQIFKERENLINNYFPISNGIYSELFDKSPTSCSLASIGTNWRLELYFPSKEKDTYLFGQMHIMLISSLIVIAFICLCLVATIRMAWRQKQLSERNRNFVDNLAHEMKTPLSNISLAARLLGKKDQPNEEFQKSRFIQVIQDESEHLNGKIEHVLQMASMEQGRYEFEFDYFNLPEMLQTAIESIRLQVESRGGRIQFINKLGHTRVFGDMIQLKQAIINLLDNANKYSPETPEIQLEVYDNEMGVYINCLDSGKGIPRQNITTIFEKFYRLSDGNIHNTKGFGIGLAFVKQVVEAHKGTIKVLSDAGRGSRFEVFLPN